MTLGCPECGSLITGEHRPDCAVGRREEMDALRHFFALMQERAASASDQVARAFKTASREAGLIRVHENDAASYHPSAHPLTAHGGRALSRGRLTMQEQRVLGRKP